MNEECARKILGAHCPQPNGALHAMGSEYLSWNPVTDSATLDGNFTAEELEAIAWWMRNKSGAAACRAELERTTP